jgi:uncharacterized membrane protein
MEIELRATIQAPVERVFAVFRDISRVAERVEGIRSVEVLRTGAEDGKGTRWRETRTLFGREATEEMEITAARAPDFYEVSAESHGTRYESRYDFNPTDDGATDVTMVFRGTPVSALAKVMGLAAFLMKGPTRKALAADIGDLKAVCEQDDSAAPS